MSRKSRNRLNGNATNASVGVLAPPQSEIRNPQSAIAFGIDATISNTNENVEVFTPEQIELLSFRRFNPLATLNAATLTTALDSYLGGYLTQVARLWERLAKQQKTIRNVKAKREEAVALRARVIERTDDSPEAFDQQAVLEHFYANARAGHALNRNVRGGFSKIVMQMMEAKSFGSAAHHLIWNPDSSQQIKLPSGKSVPSLSAKFEYVPMEFFESRTGELRFLGMTQGFTGVPLEENSWLITSEESPLMFAASVLAYYDKLATADLINFSEKFGTPGLVIHTTAQRGTPEGDAASALTKSLGANYRGTQFGASENKVEIIWPSGGTSGTSLPMHTIIEDVKRDLASLYLGADLSTQSRGGSEKAVGASVQQEGEERRERADCAWISETLNAGIDPFVIRWYFGDVPVLARVSIDAPKNEDRTVLAELTQQAVTMGAQVPIEPVMKRLNIPLAKEGENVFKIAAPTGDPILARQEAFHKFRKTFDQGDAPVLATNAAPVLASPQSPLLETALQLIGKARAYDLQPVTDRLARLEAATDTEFSIELAGLVRDLPALSREIIAETASAHAFEQSLTAALFNGLSGGSEKALATNKDEGHWVTIHGNPVLLADDGTILGGHIHGAHELPGAKIDHNKPERVIGATMQSKQGHLAAGPSHGQALDNLPEGSELEPGSDKFLTSHGRVLGREEAAQLKDTGGRKVVGGKLVKVPKSDTIKESNATAATTKSSSQGATETEAGRAARSELERTEKTDRAAGAGISERYAHQEDALYNLRQNNPAFQAAPNPANNLGKDGAEHVVEHLTNERVLKHSKGYGFAVAADASGKAELREATPHEYLARVDAQNHLFGDDTRVEGITNVDHNLGFAVSQKFRTGSTPTPKETESFMSEAGFSKVNSAAFSNAHIADKTWFDPKTGFMVSDAKPGNFIKDQSGQVIPHDVITQHLSPDDPLYQLFKKHS